jgi:hypothetical protein
VRRQVALKLVKAGMASAHVIARIHDPGVSESGRGRLRACGPRGNEGDPTKSLDQPGFSA